MARKIIIGLLAAVIIALGAFAYFQTKKKMASDKELATSDVPASPLPVAEPEASEPNPSGLPESSTETAPSPSAGTGHFEIPVPYADQAAADMAASLDNISNAEREKRVRAAFTEKGSDAAKYVKIKSLKCRDTICTMDAVATKDADGLQFQNAIVDVVRANPWIGNKIDVTTPRDNPREGRFIFFHEIAK